MARLRLNISGMTGVPCQRRIEDAINALPGIQAAVICLGRGHADIEYVDERLDPERILEAIREAGYDGRLGG